MTAAVDTKKRPARIALLGNPNTGKSTIFNRLTGLRQHIANYPGITVEMKTGAMLVGDQQVEVLDLPGAYSLAAASPDERVVMDALDGRMGKRPPDLIVCVLDATNLKRNLLLVSQAAELEIPMLVVLNQWDAVKRNGLRIDADLLADRLGVPVVTTVAKRGGGLEELKKAISHSLDEPRRIPRILWPEFIDEARDIVRNGLEETGNDVTGPEALRMIFDTDSAFADKIGHREKLKPLLKSARDRIRSHGMNPASAEPVLHYRHIEAVLDGVIEGDGMVARTRDSVDALLLNRFWGSLIFFAVMYVVFQSLYAWAGPVMDLIEAGTGWVQDLVSPLLEGTPVLQSLVSDGIIAGVGGVIVFLPQILLLFFFIAILEDTGYLARAAFLMDKLFGWCGLNGKSFVPLLSGYACAIPGVMAARTLEDPKARLTTILMTPFMSCSARLPIYVLLIGAFVEPVYGPLVAGWTLFLMHFVGAVVAMPMAWFMNRCILKIKAQPFILEMPDYRVPTLRNVTIRMWERGRAFLIQAGTVILSISIIVWALLYFPRPDEVAAKTREAFIAEKSSAMPADALAAELANPESDLSHKLDHRIGGAYIEQSYLGQFGKAVQPVFDPAGFDWKITVGVLSSFPAREVIIATMGIIYNLGADVDEGSDDLRSIIAQEKWHEGPRKGQPVYTLPVVIGLMVFFALCMQCGATVAVIAKELSWKWAVASFATMTVIAWVAAVLIYQIGSRL
ncbi:MAG: ferrous iron transport protein B [Verrucomicrobia bacterium]|nr:ferrous iron transport protein B [Verrucomicrobiota bacterium]